MFIEMRAVLDVGGSCGSGGGAFAQPCPDGTGLMFLAIFGGFAWAALAFWAGANDFFKSSGAVNPADVAGELVNEVATLYQAGARRFTLPVTRGTTRGLLRLR